MEKHSPTWRLVHSTGLHPDKAALHDVDATNAVVSAQLIELGEEVSRPKLFTIDSDWIAILELDFHVGRLVWCCFRAHRARKHALIWFHPWILKCIAFVRNVKEVCISGVRGFSTFGVWHWNALRFRITTKLGARVEIPLSPGGYHFNVWFECIVPKLKPNLVIPFTCCTMRNSICSHHFGYLNLSLRNERSGNRGSQKVDTFVHSVCTEHGEHIISHKLVAQVVDEDFLHAHLLRLLPGRFQLLSLSQIRSESHHLALVLVLQPFQDH
mmetsp:Transcript_9705/g.58851  ORF Transcript_9705/g.58851 Transcript_9705/m.58851 type:complete len:269 (+) Transcript_9705:1802-2608(+)